MLYKVSIWSKDKPVGTHDPVVYRNVCALNEDKALEKIWNTTGFSPANTDWSNVDLDDGEFWD